MNFFFWRKPENCESEETVSEIEQTEEEEAEITQEVKIALDGLDHPKKRLIELQKKLKTKTLPPPTGTPHPESSSV